MKFNTIIDFYYTLLPSTAKGSLSLDYAKNHIFKISVEFKSGVEEGLKLLRGQRLLKVQNCCVAQGIEGSKCIHKFLQTLGWLRPHLPPQLHHPCKYIWQISNNLKSLEFFNWVEIIYLQCLQFLFEQSLFYVLIDPNLQCYFTTKKCPTH